MAIARGNETTHEIDHSGLSHQDKLARTGGWWTLLLALIMLGSVGEAVHAAAWSDGLEVVRLAIMGGALLGIALAMSRFDSAFALLYGTLAGMFWVTAAVHRVLFPGLGTHDTILELLVRNAGWLDAFLRGGSVADNLVFVTQLAFVGWWLALFAMWNLVRHQRVLYAVVPAGIALLINLYYSPLNLTGYLLIFLVTVLLISVRVELARNEARWQFSRIRYAPDISIDFLKAGLGLAALAVLLSLGIPDLAGRANMERLVRPLEGPWKSVERTWTRMYRSLNYPVAAPLSGEYGKDLTLGGPVSLTDRPIFQAQFGTRTYWRAATYDQYDGRGWSNTDQETSIVDSGRWLGEPLFDATTEMTATVRPFESGLDIVYSPPQPIRVSVPVDVDWSPISQDRRLVSVSRMRSRVDINRRTGYEVVAAVTQAAVKSLQADRTAYPAWITDRYLQVPATLPQRVVELARQVAGPYSTVYDKASAIEAYLRQYPYSTTIQAPPAGRDAVDYFLFDIKEGYCDYYASAMVVMLRALGIPSRLAAGYAPGQLLPAQGDKQESGNTYQVLERNAHAWVEVFFPTYGWIQFEPTAAQPLIQRPVVVEPPAPKGTPTPPADEEDLRDLRNSSIPEASQPSLGREPVFVRWLRLHALTLIALAAIIVLAVAVLLLGRWRRRAFLRSPELLSNMFAMVSAWALRLGVPWPASDTPLEHAARFVKRVPDAEATVGQMVALFLAQRFGRRHPLSEAVERVAIEWQKLQPRLWKAWLTRIPHNRSSSPGVTPAPAVRGPRPRDLDPDRSSGISRKP